jgi:hypothetical protein
MVTSKEQLIARATLMEAIGCCNSWEPTACLIGNVTAEELGDMLRELRDRRAAETSGDCEVQWLRTLAAIVKHYGGRIEIDRHAIETLDLTQSVSSWEDHATGRRVFALQATTSTAEKAAAAP